MSCTVGVLAPTSGFRCVNSPRGISASVFNPCITNVQMARFLHVLSVSFFGVLADAQTQQCLGLWPQPQTYSCGGSILSLDPARFSFLATGVDSPELARAFQRYSSIAFIPAPALFPLNGTIVGSLISLRVDVLDADTDLGINTAENYTLVVPSSGGAALLTAPNVYGALRGLETFAQIVSWQGPSSSSFVVGACSITDFPRFRYRSAMIDSSRHFVPMPTFYAFIDAMAYSKMNVLHWHVTDDQSFPFVSATFPSLAARGAWGAGRADGSGPPIALLHSYAAADVQSIVAYARDRGIRVIPEFDSPGNGWQVGSPAVRFVHLQLLAGHTLSWGLGLPGLLTPCYTDGLPDGTFGPIDPTNPETYDTVASLLKEVAAAFPDAYMHIGGDEVCCCEHESPCQAIRFTCRPPLAGAVRLLGVQSCHHRVDDRTRRVRQLYCARVLLRAKGMVWDTGRVQAIGARDVLEFR